MRKGLATPLGSRGSGRKTWLSRSRRTHISSGVGAVARVSRRERRPTRAREVAVPAASVEAGGARVAEVRAGCGPLRGRPVVEGGGAARRWCRRCAGELVIKEVFLRGSRPVG